MQPILKAMALGAGLALYLGNAACDSDTRGKPMSSSTTTADSRTASSAPLQPAESVQESSGTAAARAFSTYAEGGRVKVPWASIVTFTIHGERVARFDSAFADRRESWDGCPVGAATYQGRHCPISPLRAVARLVQRGGEVVYQTTAPPTVGCHRYRAPSVNVATTTWIRPNKESRDCGSDFGIALSLDRAGKVVWIDFTPVEAGARYRAGEEGGQRHVCAANRADPGSGEGRRVQHVAVIVEDLDD